MPTFGKFSLDLLIHMYSLVSVSSFEIPKFDLQYIADKLRDLDGVSFNTATGYDLNLYEYKLAELRLLLDELDALDVKPKLLLFLAYVLQPYTEQFNEVTIGQRQFEYIPDLGHLVPKSF